MRIVNVINRLAYGGAETQLVALSKELARRRHKVAIYTLHSDNPLASALAGSDVDLVEDHKRCRFDPAVVVRLRSFLKRYRADVVHGYLLDGSLHARLASAGLEIPLLHGERSDSYRIPLQHRIAIKLTRRILSGAVANSHAGAGFAQAVFGLPACHTHVVWNGIGLESTDNRIRAYSGNIRQEFFESPDCKIACLVGTLRPSKDFLLALEVTKVLARMDARWRVLFVGGPAPEAPGYFDRIVNEARDLVSAGCCYFTGLRKDVVEIVSQCDVLFSTSRNEGFPNVVLEAMAAGTPAVSTDFSDIRLILPEPWQTVSSRAPEDIARAILRADHERESLSHSQRAWVQEYATIDRAADELICVYRKYVPTHNEARA